MLTLSCGAFINHPNLYCIQVDDVSWANTNWINATTSIDTTFQYFSLNCPPPNSVIDKNINKKLIKMIDIFGRETNILNKALFYIYNDGTVEKKLIVE